MARTERSGAVWGRPESVDSLGWRPGRARRIAAAVAGAASLAVGGWLGASTVAAGPAASANPDAGYEELVRQRTCATVGVVLPAERVPPQGFPDFAVVALYRADPSGATTLLVPRSHIAAAEENPDGSMSLSVTVRMGPPDDDRLVADVAGASAAGTLLASVLYDVDHRDVIDECRGES